MTRTIPTGSLISVVVPVGSRRSDVISLYRGYLAALKATGHPFEFIFVLDGPHEDELSQLSQLNLEHEPVSVVMLKRSFGEATALMAGLGEANGDWLLTLPSYDQIVPDDISRLLDGLTTADLVVAHRTPRAGNWFERGRRTIFHGLLSMVTRHEFKDLGCGARAMRREVLEEVQPYGEQARYLPVLAERMGFGVTEVDVRQSPRDRHAGIYGPRAYARGLIDILTMLFVTRFTKKPLRFFGMIGLALFVIGAVLIAWLVYDRLFLQHALADRPALLLSSLLIVLGAQLLALGLLGELLIFTHGRQLRDYQIAEVLRSARKVQADGRGTPGVALDLTSQPEAPNPERAPDRTL